MRAATATAKNLASCTAAKAHDSRHGEDFGEKILLYTGLKFFDLYLAAHMASTKQSHVADTVKKHQVGGQGGPQNNGPNIERVAMKETCWNYYKKETP